jgi:site-specific recombinase XerC
MDDDGKIPRLLVFLFGDAAKTAQRGASTRLRRWCQAFDEWLAERQQKYRSGAFVVAEQAWRRLLRQQGKLPWELTQADFEAHAAWMRAQGYASITISHELGVMANFYRWCGERQVDPECAVGFNPAAGAPRPKIRPYDGAKLLSQAELEKLLGIMRRDSSTLGRRDYAFFLARLRLGAPLRNLQQLRWGQIEGNASVGDASVADETGAWVRWRVEANRVALPGDAWEAIRAWLAASGRLEGMRQGDYTFTPLVDPLQREPIDRPQAWAAGRYLSRFQILLNLKLYGRQVGIEEHNLTLMALRRTATRLRLEAGDSLEQMQAFLDSREQPVFTKFRLRLLPQLPQEAGAGSEQEGEEGEATVQLPRRKARLIQPGEGLKHGFYAHSQPAEQVLSVLSEDIQGVEDEIAGLRTLGRGLLEMQVKAHSSKEMAQLAEAYTLTAERLAKMIEAEKRLAKPGEADRWAEDYLAMLDRVSEEMGKGPISEKVRAEALGGEPALATGARRLVEEIASTRLVLRNMLRLASEAEQKGETGEYIYLTDIYSSGCNRLMRLLRAGEGDQGRLEAFLREGMESALREEQKNWSLY